MVSVEIIYIPASNAAIHIKLEMPQGATVIEALHHSGLMAQHPEIANFPMGIFATQVAQQTVLKAGDRIEIYRPLTADPKQKRRQRAEVAR